MKPLLIAIQFLTRYPVGPRADAELLERDFGRSTGYFPLVGLLAGVDLLLMRWGLGWAGVCGRWPLAAAAILLAYWSWSMDSLHLDGLADSADALASGRRGEEMLAVMRDPRIGAFGAQAQALVLLAKFAWLASLPAGYFWALPLPMVFSRLFASLACQARPYAGKPGSLGYAYIHGAMPVDASLAIALAFSSFAALGALAVLGQAVSPALCAASLAVCLAACVVAWSFFAPARQRLEGVNGDLIGYGLEITELAAAYGLLFLLA
jgi:adenosylcobinamide-GDP ribazoletransferase